ncbi:hypothetical protein [Bradyrhizobium sp. JYMT SZCCT0428]|uniref:hypothetical protein n=1 Tax=Bradyrhizobium sp. JYMT SZCCT0428 TaxID=2807673 RepID=UPI001BACE127|nr:hypothetical protein [Bradyrhizobium sp. JYMT SZCCT0428]MBR1156107.1 hypothetical protein [Bradyrhizobium sp. JYMT SZCCT0428]
MRKTNCADADAQVSGIANRSQQAGKIQGEGNRLHHRFSARYKENQTQMYFPSPFYDGIRSDPASIVAAYNSYGAQFAIDAGIASMNDEIKISAFCSVVSYGMAPYGVS